MGIPKVAQFFAYGKCLYIRNTTTRRVQSGPDRSKRVITRKDVPFTAVNDVHLNFGSQTPKTEILGQQKRTFKRVRQKRCYADHDFFYVE